MLLNQGTAFLFRIRRRARGASTHDRKVSCHGVLLETRNANTAEQLLRQLHVEIQTVDVSEQLVTGGGELLLLQY